MDELIAKYAKLPQRQRAGGFGAVILVLLAGYWYFVYSDQATAIDKLAADYQKLDAEHTQKVAYVQNLTKYEGRLEELQQDLATLRAQLPDDPDVPQLLAQLGAKARQAALEIDRFEPKGEKVQDFYAEIAFDMKVHGSYHEVGTFIDSLGRLDRILNVTGISLSSPRTINDRIIVDGGFTIKTYRFAEEAKGKKK
jgi:type IV pilus assembly protein PilO